MTYSRWLFFPILVATLVAIGALPSVAIAQQQGSITGRIVAAETQQPLRSVSVSIPSLGSRTVTDEQGRFSIQALPVGTHTVQVELIGYKLVTRSIDVGATSEDVTIELEVDPLGLDELVVVGYGQERRRNVAGAVASLRPETVRDLSVKSLNEAMQGRLAGVQVAQNSGTPGSAITVRVRGSSSIAGGNEPLYVIDGVPLTQGDFSANTTIGFGGQDVDAVNDLNPSEIESVEILKDASAAAIYGSRASNGVVLITTKRGDAATPEITLGAYYGVQNDWRRIEMLNAQEYLDITNEGWTAAYGPASAEGYDEWYGYAQEGKSFYETFESGADTDWLSRVLRTAPISNMEASVRGGTETVRYFVSGSSLVQEGIIESMGFRRLNGRLNLDYQPLDRVILGTNIALARTVVDRARADNTIYSAWSNAMANRPTEPVYTADGDYFESLYANPVGMNEQAEAEERSIRILGNVFGTYDFANGLTARVSVGLDQLSDRFRSYDSPDFGPWSSSGGAAEASSRFKTKLTYEGTVNFDRALGELHEVSGVVGASYEDNVDDWSSVQGTQFPSAYFKYITSAATINDGESIREDWGLESYFGRLTYTYDGRITASFNARRDGSSRFGTDNRFGTFPSASVIWRLSDEGFMENQRVFGNLSVRASYGITGNQQDIGNFASRGLFEGGFNYDDQPGIAPSQLANPELRWEKTNQLNLGADFSILSDRLSFTFDYYDKRTKDLLIERPVPRTTGFETLWFNVGALENKGFELSTRADIVRASTPLGFSWTANLDLSRNRNKVTELYDNQPFSEGFVSRVEVGKPLGFYYGYVTDGIFQTDEEVAAHAAQEDGTAPGDIRFEDLDGDGLINDNDRAMIGSPWPDYEGGITNTLSFGGLDLSAFVQFSLGNELYNAVRYYMDQYGGGYDNHSKRALDRWTPENPSTTEPRAVADDPNFNTRDSDRFIEDGSYWRLKNIVLGYTLPQTLTGRLGFRSARVYVQGQNVLTATDYSGFDPEVHYGGQTAVSRGTDFYTLPQARTFTFGFNVSF